MSSMPTLRIRRTVNRTSTLLILARCPFAGTDTLGVDLAVVMESNGATRRRRCGVSAGAKSAFDSHLLKILVKW